MFDFCASSPVEGLSVTVLREPQRVPEAQRRLDSEFALECARGHPHLWASGADEAVLEHEAHDGKHGETAVGELRVQAPLPRRRVLDALGKGHAQVADVLEVTWCPV